MNDPYLLDDYGGTTELLHDLGNDQFAIQRVTNVQSVLDANEAKRNAGDGYSPSREFRHIAEVPVAWIEQQSRNWGVDLMAKENEALFMRLLRDPENAYFRISEGRFG